MSEEVVGTCPHCRWRTVVRRGALYVCLNMDCLVGEWRPDEAEVLDPRHR